MKVSSPFLGKRVLPITNSELAEITAAALGPYSQKQAAAAANRTPEAAKAWKRKLAAPDGSSIINLAVNIPAIDWLVRGEIDRRRGGPERYAAELVTGLLRLADGDSHVARRARATLNEISRLMAGHQASGHQALGHQASAASVCAGAIPPKDAGGGVAPASGVPAEASHI